MTEVLNLYTIYERPADYPQGYVVREFQVAQGGATYTGEAKVADSLEQARELVPAGLVNMHRDPLDPPQVVESWV